MVYVALGLVALLIGAWTTIYISKLGIKDQTNVALDQLEQVHEREKAIDKEEAKTADPVDYLNAGLDRLR